MIADMTDHPTTQTTDHPTDTVGGRAANWLAGAFYAGVAAVALAGQTTAATSWLNWPTEFALPAVALLELGGIALAARSDYRRGLGERAVAARVLSAAVAVFAVVFNWLGHTDHLAGGFFAGMSALGYSVWLINAGDRRRDQLRRDRRLLAPPPAYGIAQWLRHPGITRRAHTLAVADPKLGLHESLIKAATQIRDERRHAVIAKLLRAKLAKDKDPLAAEIAVSVYDLDQIAARLAAEADYDGLASLIAVDLDPGRLLGDRPNGKQRKTADTPNPNHVDTPKPKASTDRKPATNRPAAKATSRPVARPGERAAVGNARFLREIYPTGLPDSGRQIRLRTGWSKDRVDEAVAAYRAGEDLADDEEHHTSATPQLAEAR